MLYYLDILKDSAEKAQADNIQALLMPKIAKMPYYLFLILVFILLAIKQRLISPKNQKNIQVQILEDVLIDPFKDH